MAPKIYQYELPSDTKLSEIDEKLEKMLKNDNLDYHSIRYGFPGDNGEGEELLNKTNTINNEDGKFLIFDYTAKAYTFVCEYKGYGSRLVNEILYVTHVKDDKDPLGWSYYAFGVFSSY